MSIEERHDVERYDRRRTSGDHVTRTLAKTTTRQTGTHCLLVNKPVSPPDRNPIKAPHMVKSIEETHENVNSRLERDASEDQLFHFKRRHGVEVRFKREMEWIAEVRERQGYFTKTQSLPVVAPKGVEISLLLHEFSQYSALGQEQRIHIETQRGVVYLGSRGLLGGGKKAESQPPVIGPDETAIVSEERASDTAKLASVYEFIDTLDCDCLRSSDINPLMDLIECPIEFEDTAELPLAEQFDILTTVRTASRHEMRSSIESAPSVRSTFSRATRSSRSGSVHHKDSAEGRKLLLTEQTRLVEYVNASRINSIKELVEAIGCVEEQIELRLLLEWAEEYIQTFAEMSIGRMTDSELDEYFTFSELAPVGEQRQKCLLEWICSVTEKVGETEEGQAALVERLEFTLHRMEADVFEERPGILIALCSRLLANLDNQMSTSDHLYLSRLLYAIRRALLLLQRVAPQQWSPNGGRSLTEIFKNRLKSLHQSSDHYPIRFLTELLGENISQFELTGFHIRHKDTQKRIGMNLDDAPGFVDVLRNLATLGLDVEKLDQGCRRWQDAFRVNANANLKPWYIQYQNINKDALLTLYDPKHLTTFQQSLQQIRKRRLGSKYDERRKALEFGVVSITGMLILHSKTENVRLKCLSDLIGMRDEWNVDRDVIRQILDTLLSIAAKGGGVESSMARSALLDWMRLKAPSHLSRIFKCLAPNGRGKTSLSRGQIARLRLAMSEWLGHETVDTAIKSCATAHEAPDISKNGFFRSVGSASAAAAEMTVTPCHELIDKKRIRVALSAPPLVPFFKGRETEREAILRELQASSDLVRVPPIIGPSGSGKTQLICKVLETQRRFTKYKHEFWVPASSRQSIVDAFIKMARLLEISPHENVDITVECVKSRLKRDLCLYVFDDAPSLAAIQEFLPVGRGHVIIISEEIDDSQWNSGESVIRLKPFGGREFSDLADSFGIKGEEIDIGETLAEAVPTPLAVVQLFATLQTGRRHGSPSAESDWIEAIEQFKATGGSQVVERAVAALRQTTSPEGAVAIHLLAQLSVVASESVPIDWMLLWDSKDISIRKKLTRKAMALLHDYALLLVDKDQQKVHVHPLTQVALRELKLVPDYTALIKSLINYCGEMDGDQSNYGCARMTTLSHARALIARLQSIEKTEIESEQLAKHLSYSCRGVQLIDEGLHWAWLRLSFARKRHRNGDHDDVVSAITGLARILDETSRLDEAWDLWKDAKEMALRLHRDTGSIFIAKLLVSYGHHASRLDKTGEALVTYDAAIDFLTNASAEDESDLLIRLLNDTADCCSRLEMIERTVKIREEVAKKIRRKYRGLNEPISARCISNLAVSMARAGMKAESFRNLRTAVDIAEGLYQGKAHPDLCRLLHNLGCVSTDLGKKHDSVTYSKRAVDMLRRLHGRNDHEDSARALHARSLGLCQYGRSGEGLKCAEEALKMCQRLSKGKERPELARYQRTVALLHQEQDDDKGAEVFSDQASSLSLKLQKNSSLKRQRITTSTRSSASSSILLAAADYKTFGSSSSDQPGTASSQS